MVVGKRLLLVSQAESEVYEVQRSTGDPKVLHLYQVSAAADGRLEPASLGKFGVTSILVSLAQFLVRR